MYLCHIQENLLEMRYVAQDEVWRSCNTNLPVPSRSEFPEATSFIAVFKLSWKFRSSWFFSAAASPSTLIQRCIFVPHVRTRFCVLIVFSRCKSPCTLPIRMTACLEYLRTFRRNRTLHSRRTCQLVAACETKFNLGFEFARILSSPFSSCILFVIVSRELMELRF